MNTASLSASQSRQSAAILQGFTIDAPVRQSITSALTAAARRALRTARRVCTLRTAIYSLGVYGVAAMWWHIITIDETLAAQTQVAIDTLFALPALIYGFLFDTSAPHSNNSASKTVSPKLAKKGGLK